MSCQILNSIRISYCKIPGLDLFLVIHNLLRYHGFMKKCPICGRKVVSKRKDAIYCRNPRCRKAAYLAKKEQAATAPLPIGPNKASVVVSFPDGSRWLMELTPLQTMEKAQIPTLTQVLSPVDSSSLDALPQTESEVNPHLSTSENGLEQITASFSEAAEDVGTNEGGAAGSTSDEALIGSENGSESVPSVVCKEPDSSDLSAVPMAEAAETSPLVAEAAGRAAPVAIEVPTEASSEPREPALRTVELYFVDSAGHRLAFDLAVRFDGKRCRITSGAYARLGFAPSEGVGLGGTPGRWKDVYPHKAPSEYGFVDNIGVLCWEDDERRAYAAEAGLLHLALGVGWQERLRQTATLKFG